MDVAIWALVAGLLLIFIALSATVLKRLPLSTSMLYLGFGMLAGPWGLGLPLGACLLLGGILAPTDPVLASDVQMTDPRDRDSLRFALTAEGGLNDGTAFPFVLLGLGLLGANDLGELGWRWFLVNGLWA